MAGTAVSAQSVKNLFFKHRDRLPVATAFYARFSNESWQRFQTDLTDANSYWHKRFCQLMGPSPLQAMDSEILSSSLRRLTFQEQIPTTAFHQFMQEFNEAQT